MNDHQDRLNPPTLLQGILQATEASGFTMACDPQTGSLLRTLAASKPGGRFLELGTGTGVGTCWLLDGMDAQSHLVTVEQDARVSTMAQTVLGSDSRVEFIIGDGGEYLKQSRAVEFDFIFADTFPGKFHLLDEALQGLRQGGIYFIDDLAPQPTWPPMHEPKVTALLDALENRKDLRITKLGWASGLIIAVKV